MKCSSPESNPDRPTLLSAGCEVNGCANSSRRKSWRLSRTGNDSSSRTLQPVEPATRKMSVPTCNKNFFGWGSMEVGLHWGSLAWNRQDSGSKVLNKEWMPKITHLPCEIQRRNWRCWHELCFPKRNVLLFPRTNLCTVSSRTVALRVGSSSWQVPRNYEGWTTPVSQRKSQGTTQDAAHWSLCFFSEMAPCHCIHCTSVRFSSCQGWLVA